MEIHTYERFFYKKYWKHMLITSRNMEFEKKGTPMSMSSTHHALQKQASSVFWSCLLMLQIWHLVQIIHDRLQCSWHVPVKTPKNSSRQNLTIIGHTHIKLKEAWLLVLANHPHHSPSLENFHSNLSAYGRCYPMANSPTHPCLQHIPPTKHSRLSLGCKINLCSYNPLKNDKIQEITTQSSKIINNIIPVAHLQI